MFCGDCGSSIGIDFRELDPPNYGISVSTNRSRRGWFLLLLKHIPRCTRSSLYLTRRKKNTAQARTINDVDLDSLQYKKLDGKKVYPPEDLSGQEHGKQASS